MISKMYSVHISELAGWRRARYTRVHTSRQKTTRALNSISESDPQATDSRHIKRTKAVTGAGWTKMAPQQPSKAAVVPIDVCTYCLYSSTTCRFRRELRRNEHGSNRIARTIDRRCRRRQCGFGVPLSFARRLARHGLAYVMLPKLMLESRLRRRCILTLRPLWRP